MEPLIADPEQQPPLADPFPEAPPEDPSQTCYLGRWTPLGRAVFIWGEGELRALRLGDSALVRGYAWGRRGSGPREVARAILLDATGNEMLAERLCRPYTWEVISRLPTAGFRITAAEVSAWVEEVPDPCRGGGRESSGCSQESFGTVLGRAARVRP